MRVVALVPRRAGNEERDRLWEFTRAWWAKDHPGWKTIEGHHDGGPFNRSAAINTAAESAGEWDVAVIVDADVIANPGAVRSAVEIAAATDRMVVSHHERIMLTKAGTEKILGGYRGSWRDRNFVQTIYTDSVSCAVAVSRKLFELAGGFDECFVGWGYEDTAFEVAVETLTGQPLIRLASELFHLHHELAPEARTRSPMHIANRDRRDRYLAARGDLDAVKALLDEATTIREPVELGPTRIPRILHRTVPAERNAEWDEWWAEQQYLHPGWEFRDWRDPLDPKDWPLTGGLWDRCANGAQKAGLIRLEALITRGGVYVDGDVKPYRSFEPLLQVPAFAAWEDETTVPDAVLGAEPQHPALVLALEKARAVIEGGGDAWHSGPGVTTEILPRRTDVLVLPPGAFYPHSYLQKHKAEEDAGPWVFCRHMWHGSWLSPQQRRSIQSRQRR